MISHFKYVTGLFVVQKKLAKWSNPQKNLIVRVLSSTNPDQSSDFTMDKLREGACELVAS